MRAGGADADSRPGSPRHRHDSTSAATAAVARATTRGSRVAAAGRASSTDAHADAGAARSNTAAAGSAAVPCADRDTRAGGSITAATGRTARAGRCSPTGCAVAAASRCTASTG